MAMATSSMNIDPSELSRSFRFAKVLNENPTGRSVTFLGTFERSKTESTSAILLVEKTHFDVNDYEDLTSMVERVETLGDNDVYHWLKGWLSHADARAASRPDLKLTLIWPANEGHIKKYGRQTMRMHCESPEIYRTRVRPYQDSVPLEKIAWVYNILEHKKESESIVYEDPDDLTGFIVLPDLKWDQKTLPSLYLTAIVRRRDLKSIRDLRQSDLPLLRNLRRGVYEAVCTRYAVEKTQLRLFFHYQPTFYHLHLHIVHIAYTGFQGITVGQAHLLDQVIDNLELVPDFYARCTLTYALGENHDLAVMVPLLD